MAMDDYIRARRLGLKVFHANVQRHVSPYLPVLDEIAVKVNELTHRNLGLMQIPLKNVVGTGTKGRTNAFAANFMPILEPNSEFSDKWSRLYDSVVQDGMRQPVTVLEYLNKYYLLEGNKRVSVMKYLDAVFVEAEVTRVVPRRTSDKENRLYFEFLPFYRDTNLNMIWFSQLGSYARLYELTGHTPGTAWTSEESMDLRAAYMRFRGEYKALFGDRIGGITTGDAFLIYLTVYGYEGAPHKIPAELQDELKRLKSEFERGEGGETVSLVMEPTEQRAPGFISQLFLPSKVKVAFLYHRAPADSGWNYWHDLGRINAENELGDRMETTVRVCEEPEQFDGALEELIQEGNRLIFATSPLMLSSCVKPSLAHPEVRILNCSLLASYYHVRSYYLRIYEAKFLIGMIAGAAAENGQIGYVADYPIYGVPANVNAFAMGARMVNPRARVHLAWSTREDFDPANPFPGRDIHVISNRDINAPSHSSMEYGLYSVADGVVRNLAIPVLDWSRFYTSMTNSYLSGAFDQDASGKSALDYWWGMSSDALDIVLSTRTDPGIRRLVNLMHGQIESGQLMPFEGELVSQDGQVICGSDEQLSPADIIAMNYLADNVEGEIPETKSLRPSARAMVETLGLREIARPDITSFGWPEKRETR